VGAIGLLVVGLARPVGTADGSAAPPHPEEIVATATTRTDTICVEASRKPRRDRAHRDSCCLPTVGRCTLRLPDRIPLAFARVVERVLQSGAVTRPRHLGDRLRPLYPLATVPMRVLSGEAARTWYVYRDGQYDPVVAWELSSVSTESEVQISLRPVRIVAGRVSARA